MITTVVALVACSPIGSTRSAAIPLAHLARAPRVYYLTNASGASSVTTKTARLLVLDPDTLEVRRTVRVGARPHHFYPVVGSRDAYISHFVGHVIEVVDVIENRIVTRIELPVARDRRAATQAYIHRQHLLNGGDHAHAGGGPVHLVFSPDFAAAFSMNSLSGSVSKIDTRTHTVTGTARVGSVPYFGAANAAGTLLFVANLGGDTVSVVDVATMRTIHEVRVGAGPMVPLLTPDQRTIAVTLTAARAVAFIDVDTLSVRGTVQLSGQVRYPDIPPRMVASFDPSGRLWVGNERAGVFNIVDPTTMSEVATIPAAEGADQMFFVHDGPAAGVGIGTNRYADSVSVIDAASLDVTTLDVGGTGTHWVSLDAAGSTGYISERVTGGVTKVDLRTGSPVVVAHANPGPAPDQAMYLWLDHDRIEVNPTSLGFG
ncbi:MAG TPA: hypothetical protein VIH82_07330 [Acidimicrobiia bacterium]